MGELSVALISLAIIDATKDLRDQSAVGDGSPTSSALCCVELGLPSSAGALAHGELSIEVGHPSEATANKNIG